MGQVYGIAEEELDEDLVLGILWHPNVTPPSAETLSSLGVIDTPIKIAQFVRQARQQH